MSVANVFPMQREKLVKSAIFWFDMMGLVCVMALALSFLWFIANSTGPEWTVTVYFNKFGEVAQDIGAGIFTFIWGVSKAYRMSRTMLRSMP